MRVFLAFSVLLTSTTLSFGGKLDNLPDLDPEQNPPGLETPRGAVPPPGVRSPPPVVVVPPPAVRAGPPPGYGPPRGYVPPEVARTAQLYDGYRGPRPYYRPYYNPQPYYGPPSGYYGAPPVDPAMVILGVIANQVIPAIIYHNRRRY